MATQWWKPKGFLRNAGRPITPGAAPGTLIVDPKAARPEVRVFGYGPESRPEDTDKYEERIVDSVEEIAALRDKWPCIWVDVVGLGDLEFIEKLGDLFQLHRLALEDVLNVNQRSKAEEYDNSLFMVMRFVTLEEELSSEQISLFLGDGFVLSFQELEGDSFEGVRDRLRKGRRRIRSGSDYLAYALLDSMVDFIFPLLDKYSDRLENLEEEVLTDPGKATLTRLHSIKHELMTIRRAVWPVRELLNTILHDDTEYFQGENALFLRDCQDHALQAMEMIEHYREMASGLIDAYLSSLSNRMNDVMRVLTLIATIFIPLSFIAGLYGMNFKYMPELESRYGYPAVLFLMASVAFGFLVYLKRKKWL